MKKSVLILFFILVCIFGVDASILQGNVYNNETKINSTLSLFNVDSLNEVLINAENGEYKYDISPGTYILTQKLNDNEIPSYPQFGFYHLVVKDNDVLNNDFGIFKLGKIYGYVQDENGNKLSKIKIILSNNFTYLTDDSGYYDFSNLEYGTYKISIGENSKDIEITSGKIVENNFTLKEYVQEIPQEEKISWLDRLYRKIFI